jgi:hypothetical protein
VKSFDLIRSEHTIYILQFDTIKQVQKIDTIRTTSIWMVWYILHLTTCEFCIYKHSMISYNCNHERRCSGNFIGKIITPLTVELLKYQRNGNYTLMVLEMQYFHISNSSRFWPEVNKNYTIWNKNEKLCSFVVLMIFISDPTSCICVILFIP